MGGGVARESSSSSSRAKGNERIVARHASSSSSVSPRQHDGRTSSEPPSRKKPPESWRDISRSVGCARSSESTDASSHSPSCVVLCHQSRSTDTKPSSAVATTPDSS